jgi:hypothetical protein
VDQRAQAQPAEQHCSELRELDCALVRLRAQLRHAQDQEQQLDYSEIHRIEAVIKHIRGETESRRETVARQQEVLGQLSLEVEGLLARRDEIKLARKIALA